MTFSGWLTIFLFVILLTLFAIPVGSYLTRVYTGERTFLDPLFRVPERLAYRVLHVDPDKGQDWKQYARSLIIFSLVGWLLLYLILRTQTLWDFTGLNPQHFHSGTWNESFNTASSFMTNTNWQYYSGETTMSYFSQMAGLTVQNFLSAGVGIVVAVALIRGIIGRSGKSLGNFWQDIVRTVLWVLTPMSIVIAIVLVWQGSIQNFSHYLSVDGITGLGQQIAMGPAASQEAIKMLGTNGGGFFNVNSAHPFENPNGFTNFFEMLVVLIIPAALVFQYGKMSGNRRQGYDDGHVPGRGLGRLRGRGARIARPARRRPAHSGGRRLERREPRGQGGALRYRRLRAVRRGHHSHLVRCRQQRDRVLHGDRRCRSLRQPVRQ
jgi:K+-transporting ATPase ATPase A chain